MKIKEGYKVREIAGEYLIINQGASELDMTKIISLNSSALMLWNSFIEKEFTIEQVADKLVEVYAIDNALAVKDGTVWCEMLQHQGIIE